MKYSRKVLQTQNQCQLVKCASPLRKFRKIRTMLKYVKVHLSSSLGKVKLEKRNDAFISASHG